MLATRPLTSITTRLAGRCLRAVAFRSRQQGVVLMMALIMLVALTLAGAALVRSVDTSILIAGNLSFKQSALSAGDAGAENAVSWIANRNANGVLFNPVAGEAHYSPSRGADPVAGTTWDAYWNLVAPNPAVITNAATGNTVSYVIHRLCNATGDPAVAATGCSVSPFAGSSTGSSKGAGVIKLQYSSQVYYRITTRVVGPRNTVSYTQTIVAM